MHICMHVFMCVYRRVKPEDLVEKRVGPCTESRRRHRDRKNTTPKRVRWLGFLPRLQTHGIDMGQLSPAATCFGAKFGWSQLSPLRSVWVHARCARVLCSVPVRFHAACGGLHLSLAFGSLHMYCCN